MSEQFFMLVRHGFVQRMPVVMNGNQELVWPVARTHKDALRLSKKFGVRDVRPALIGSIEGETIGGHLCLALDEGCVGMAVVGGWDPSGDPVWDYLPFDGIGGDE